MSRALLLAVFIILPLSGHACSGDLKLPARRSGFDVAPRASDAVPVVKMLPGIASPAQDVELAAPLSGVLMDVLVREGDFVEVGQILAVMDNRIAAAELRLAEVTSQQDAAITQARASLRHAEEMLTRLLSVSDRRAVAEIEIERARNSRDQAAAALSAVDEQSRVAEANLALARARLEAHDIRTPLAGHAVRVDARPGETVNGSETLIHIVDIRTLRVELRVPIYWYGRLKAGTQYHLAASAPVDAVIPATLKSFEPIVDAATQTFRCVFEIDNSDKELPAGFAARLIRPDVKEKIE